MIRLVLPDAGRYAEWKAAFDEYGAGPKDGTGYVAAPVDTSEEAFADYLADRAREGDNALIPALGRVHCTYFWVVDDDAADGEPQGLLGFLSLRHGLTAALLESHGHIGYSVRPAARGRGVAKAALRAGLVEAAKLGIAPVLVSCSVDNDASRAVIEACGGQFDDIRHGSRRYWFGDEPRPTSPTA